MIAVVFDLDGTLLDTLTDIAESMNEVLAENGWPIHPVADYNTFVGDGIETLARRTIPKAVQTPELLDACVKRNRQIYDQRNHCKTKPYDGIEAMLDTLLSRGATLSVLSNKPHDFVVPCVAQFFPKIPFAHVYGVRADIPKKPNPTGIQKILADWPKDAQVTYVGDTNTDMRTAKAVDLYAVGVSWGFRPREELEAEGANAIIDHASELPNHVFRNV